MVEYIEVTLLVIYNVNPNHPKEGGGPPPPPTGNPNISKTDYAIKTSFSEFVEESFAVILYKKILTYFLN